MPISPADIAALYAKIDSEIDFHKSKIADLQTERKSVEVVERRVKSEQAEQRLLFEAPTSVTAGEPTVSFAESCRRAVAAFKDETFSVPDVENMLRSMSATLPKNNLRTRIAVEVKDLVRKKQVVLVERGSGHVPHKYRRTVQAIEDAQKSEKARLSQLRAFSVQH